ncbi:hypothetical protein CB1_001028004 [Camelus ferus]|nr:hypothetical protein CB1_001028004 [Camelus ferus]
MLALCSAIAPTAWVLDAGHPREGPLLGLQNRPWRSERKRMREGGLASSLASLRACLSLCGPIQAEALSMTLNLALEQLRSHPEALEALGTPLQVHHLRLTDKDNFVDIADAKVTRPPCGSDLGQGCGVEQAGAGGQGVVAAGTEVSVLPPEIWAASLEDLSALGLGLSCEVAWAESGHCGWEMHCCVLPGPQDRMPSVWLDLLTLQGRNPVIAVDIYIPLLEAMMCICSPPLPVYPVITVAQPWTPSNDPEDILENTRSSEAKEITANRSKTTANKRQSDSHVPLRKLLVSAYKLLPSCDAGRLQRDQSAQQWCSNDAAEKDTALKESKRPVESPVPHGGLVT